MCIQNNWKNILNKEFKKSYFAKLIHSIKKEYENNICYPEKKIYLHVLNIVISIY